MLKKFRKYYWKKRDEGKGRQVKMLVLIFSLLSILLMFAMTVRVYKSVKLYNQRNVERRQKSVKGDSASPEAVSGSSVGMEYDGEDDDDEAEDQENQTVDDASTKENDSDEVNIDTTNMDSFLAFMSDESYEKLLDLVSGTCEEKSCTSAKRLDYQEIDQDTYLVTSYILLSDGSVYKSDYNMKSGAVTFAATDYREADIIALRNNAEEAESLAIAKEQEAESKKLEDAKTNSDSDEDKASSESKKNSISINIKNKKTYKISKKVRIKSSKRLKSIKLNGKKIRFKKNSKRKTFKLRSYKGKLKKSRWNKLIVKDVTGNKLTIKFKIKK